jgi:hypothetical protein
LGVAEARIGERVWLERAMEAPIRHGRAIHRPIGVPGRDPAGRCRAR